MCNGSVSTSTVTPLVVPRRAPVVLHLAKGKFAASAMCGVRADDRHLLTPFKREVDCPDCKLAMVDAA